MRDRNLPSAKLSVRLWQGAAVLGAAAVISKVLGTIQKIPLQNIAGDGVFGIYNAVYPLYTFMLVLATAGIPIAVSKFVSEAMALGREREAERVFRLANRLMTASGVIGFALLYFGAPAIAGWIGDAQTAWAIRSIAFAMLFMPLTAVLRGYFQGLQDMVPTAVSQVAEQFVRVAVMVTLLLLLVGRGASDAAIAAGATFGSTAGSVAALAAAWWFWRAHRRGGAGAGVRAARGGGADAGERGAAGADRSVSEPVGEVSEAERSLSGGATSEPEAGGPIRVKACDTATRSAAAGASQPQELDRESTASLLRRFATFALPVSLGAVALPLLTLVDTFTMPRLLQHDGLGEAAAMAEFGLYNHGLPLVQLVSMIVTTMSVALVPAMNEARLRGDWETIRRQTGTVLRLGWMIGLAASVGLALLARPMNIMLFSDAAGSGVMAILACTTAFGVLQIVSGAVLQGLGAERTPVYGLLVAVAVKIGLNLLFMPLWGIHGAAVAAVAAYAAAAATNGIRLSRMLQARPAWGRDALRPALAAAGMAAGLALWLAAAAWALRALPFAPPERAAQTVVALSATAGG
uniref:polysaccharide biosynthesis protein n=1 Tax=Paenibacillus koleovorans TaxID=121608 RepID=UPI0013E36499